MMIDLPLEGLVLEPRLQSFISALENAYGVLFVLSVDETASGVYTVPCITMIGAKVIGDDLARNQVDLLLPVGASWVDEGVFGKFISEGAYSILSWFKGRK